MYVYGYRDVQVLLFMCVLIKVFKYFNSYCTGNSVSSSNASNASNSTGVTCHEDFLEEDSLCYPRCDKFAQSSGSAGRFLSLSGLISVVILAVLSILILLFSVWTHKEM